MLWREEGGQGPLGGWVVRGCVKGLFTPSECSKCDIDNN